MAVPEAWAPPRGRLRIRISTCDFVHPLGQGRCSPPIPPSVCPPPEAPHSPLPSPPSLNPLPTSADCCAGGWYATSLMGCFLNGARCLGCALCRLTVARVEYRCSLFCCVPWRCQAVKATNFGALSIYHGEGSKFTSKFTFTYAQQHPGTEENQFLKIDH